MNRTLFGFLIPLVLCGIVLLLSVLSYKFSFISYLWFWIVNTFVLIVLLGEMGVFWLDVRNMYQELHHKKKD